MPDPNADPPQLPKRFEPVKIKLRDGHCQYGYWNGFHWASEGKPLEDGVVVEWEPWLFQADKPKT